MKARRISLKGITHTLSRTVSWIFSRPITLKLESPVPHLLNSNMAPTEDEITLIKGTIKIAESDIEVVFEDPHISRGNIHDTSKLEEHRTALIQFKQIHKAILSPIRRVPREILVLIFLDAYCYRFCDIPPVSQVCRFWREVALSTPRLWSEIGLNFNSKKLWPRMSSSYMSILDLKLRRSHNTQLDIHISAFLPSHADHPAFQKILDCSDRWGIAYLWMPGFILPWMDRIKGRIPALRKLIITIKSPVIDHPCSVFQQAPLLQSIYVCGVQNLSLPWTQLLSYENFGGDVADNQQKICLLTYASTLKISWSTDLFIPTNSLVCTNLKILHVSFRPDAHKEFFVRIQAPKIKEIEIRRVSGDVTPHLLIMIRKTPSPCLLQSLTFHHDFDHPESLTALLWLTPELEKLDIHLPHETDLRHFIFEPAANAVPLVPKLRTLCFRVNTIHGYEDIITQVASSRCEPVSLRTTGREDRRTLATLDSFTLRFRDYPTRLKELRLLEGSIMNSQVPEEFDHWASVLERALRPSSASIKKNINQVNDILSSLMTGPINVHYLYLTGIHVILNDFVNWSSNISERYDRKHKLRCRASDIVKRWEGPILTDIPNRRWGLSYNTSLGYVPVRDVLRSKNPLSIAYGPLWNYRRIGFKAP